MAKRFFVSINRKTGKPYPKGTSKRELAKGYLGVYNETTGELVAAYPDTDAYAGAAKVRKATGKKEPEDIRVIRKVLDGDKQKAIAKAKKARVLREAAAPAAPKPDIFVSIDPKTKRPFPEGTSREMLAKGYLGLATAEGEVLASFRGVNALEGVAIARYELQGEKPTPQNLKKILADAAAPARPKRAIVFTNMRGFVVAKPEVGMVGHWAVRQADGRVMLLQLPKELPAKPKRKLPKNATPEQQAAYKRRKEAMPKVQVPEAQPYSKAAHRFMNEQLERDLGGGITLCVTAQGIVAAPHRARREMVLRLDQYGRDSLMHDKLAWIKLDPYEIAMMHRSSIPVHLETLTAWMPLNSERSVRASIGRLSAEIDTELLQEMRDTGHRFIQLEAQVKLGDRAPISSFVDLGQDSEQLYKRAAKAITDSLAGVGWRWTKLSRMNEDEDDGAMENEDFDEVEEEEEEAAEKLGEQVAAKMARLVDPLDPEGGKFLKALGIPLSGSPQKVAVSKLRQVEVQGQVRFTLRIMRK